MQQKQTVSCVIVAAGVGQRFGSDKLMLNLAGQTVLQRSVAAFCLPSIDEILVVANQEKLPIYKDLLTKKLPDAPLRFILGGQERWQSSLTGIQAATGTLVMIHDGARPLIDQQLIEESIALADENGAALVAAPATDSIKIVNQEGAVVDAIERQKVYLAQTPQTFQRSLILAAYQQALAANYQAMTDDVELVTKFLHQPVKVVAGDNQNIKITYPSDRSLAETIAKNID